MTSHPLPVHKGRKTIAALSAGMLLAVSGCGSDEPPVREAASPATSSAPSTPATTPTSSAKPSASTTTDGSSTPTTVDPAEMVFFQAPSGNIACSLSGDQASCDISDYSYTPPQTPADCDLDFGGMINLEVGEPAAFVCHGDTNAVGDQSLPSDRGPLPYGEQLSNGVFVCSSSEDGLSCETADGVHGFTLSRAEYTVF